MDTKVTEYTVVSEHDLSSLVGAVCNLIKEGYQPLGGAQVTESFYGLISCLTQADCGRIVALFMQSTQATYSAMRTASVIVNVPTVRRVSWLCVKQLNPTGRQEETI